MAETRTGNRRVLRGVVVSDRMDKTIVVEVRTLKAHPTYKKRFRTTKKYYAHDEQNQCGIGDTVTISETRPFSRLKRWRLLEIVEKAR
ncbi:MAG TPA: 30S ribosomal protein S17 [Candidatus Sabulitectum sp.]|nr:30S ribosomal protein S17 [Candidatus Sabulitectum sp.]HPF31515.1 30S ribosomal protein S17 [Candidatus Sabulitectum sp.]HPJ27952.1 30S ribosomal protein S17 [Candidatus Sabulitectum sp.]HPR21755.1 30S ribosomal protein S17 [Candidatus Sabulitectum sp.]